MAEVNLSLRSRPPRLSLSLRNCVRHADAAALASGALFSTICAEINCKQVSIAFTLLAMNVVVAVLMAFWHVFRLDCAVPDANATRALVTAARRQTTCVTDLFMELPRFPVLE